MRILLALIILLCGSQVLAASNDVLLNLKDPSSSNPLTPTLKVEGKVDGATNPTVKVPMLPCVANAVAPTWAEGSIVPCSTDLAGTMRTSTSGGGSTYLDADAIANQTTTAVHGQTYMYNGATWDRVRGTIVGGLQVNCVTGCSGGSSTPTDTFANPTTAGLSQTFNMMYNGATWDLMRGTVGGGVLVNVSNASLAVTGTFFQATQPVSIAGTVAVTQSGVWSTGRTWTLASGTDSVTVTDGAGALNVIVDSGTLTAVTSITNTVTVQGAKTNNNAAPGATNVGVLPYVATAVAPSNTEGNQTGCSQNLSGAQRVIEQNFVATANNDGACASGAASFTAIVSNASRTWLAVWASPANTDDVYLKLGATATAADARFAPGQPLNFTSGRIYTGIIDAFPASGTQAVCVMELN
jgi:hypothetical protein